MMPAPITSDTTHQGFSLFHYIHNVKQTFEEIFQSHTNEGKPVIEADSIIFDQTSRYLDNPAQNKPESEKIAVEAELPAIVIDPYEMKIDPAFDEYRQDKDTPHTNTGNLGLYLFMRTLALMSNSNSPRAYYYVRQFAVDIAAIITNSEGFNSRVGMSQVTHVQEAPLHIQNELVIGWMVQWQHSVELEMPDYSDPKRRYDRYKADHKTRKEISASKVDELFIIEGTPNSEEKGEPVKNEIVRDNEGNPVAPFFIEKETDRE